MKTFLTLIFLIIAIVAVIVVFKDFFKYVFNEVGWFLYVGISLGAGAGLTGLILNESSFDETHGIPGILLWIVCSFFMLFFIQFVFHKGIDFLQDFFKIKKSYSILILVMLLVITIALIGIFTNFMGYRF